MIRNDIITGDALEQLQQLPDESVHCVVTSPPYYGLRDYGVDEQIGLEETPEGYIEKLVTIFREVQRVLRSDGTVWLNMGDSYSSGSNNPSPIHASDNVGNAPRRNVGGMRPKQLLMMPARVAIALQADGWWLRSDIIWHKPNPMPESVTDRPTRSHEHIFMLTKAARYWYDADAIREPHKDISMRRAMRGRNVNKYTAGNSLPPGVHANTMSQPKAHEGYENMNEAVANGDTSLHANGRNKRDVWTVATQPYPEAHFATFPVVLIEPCILAGCPETCCAECGAGYVRVVERVKLLESTSPRYAGVSMRNDANDSRYKTQHHTIGFQPSCICDTEATQPGIVLDPFGGAGTTAIAAIKHNRDYLLIELSAEYVGLAEKRIREYQQALQNADPLQPIVYADGSKQLSLFDNAKGAN